MKFHGVEFRLATNADVPMLPVLLEKETERAMVLVRNLWIGDLPPFRFAFLVMSPYTVLDEDGHFIIYGFDRQTGLASKARIVGEVFQYPNVHLPEWEKTSDALRLYVPASIPIPA